jgi:hypothetical protein
MLSMRMRAPMPLVAPTLDTFNSLAQAPVHATTQAV